ncbi:MAG: thermonuclease family protein [Candidatus Thiodiazotropha sp.]
MLFFLLIGLSPFNSCYAATAEGQVVEIASGDRITIRLSNGEYRGVKLLGIRIPNPARDSASIAKRHLSMLLAGRFISVEYTTLSPRGVILGTVLHGGSDVALRMLSDGFAVTANHPRLQPSRLKRYKQAETTARARGLGVWQTLR